MIQQAKGTAADTSMSLPKTQEEPVELEGKITIASRENHMDNLNSTHNKLFDVLKELPTATLTIQTTVPLTTPIVLAGRSPYTVAPTTNALTIDTLAPILQKIVALAMAKYKLPLVTPL